MAEYEYIMKMEKDMDGIECYIPKGELIRCKDCKWFGDEGCAILIVDDSDKPKEDDFCSFAEKENR